MHRGCSCVGRWTAAPWLHGMVHGMVRGMMRGMVHGMVYGMVRGMVHGMVRLPRGMVVQLHGMLGSCMAQPCQHDCCETIWTSSGADPLHTRKCCIHLACA